MLIKRAFNKDYINKTHASNSTFFSPQRDGKKQSQKIKLALLFLLLAITAALLFFFITGEKNKQDQPVIIEASKTPHKISYHHKVEESYMSKSLYTTFNKEDDNISAVTLHENNEMATLTEILKKEVALLWKAKKTDSAPPYFKLGSTLSEKFNNDKIQHLEQIVVKNVLSKNENYKIADKKKEYKVRINLCSSMRQVEALKAQVISRHPIMFTKHKFIIEQVLNDGEVLYYLSLGPYKKYGTANSVVQQMKKIGYRCFVCK